MNIYNGKTCLRHLWQIHVDNLTVSQLQLSPATHILDLNPQNEQMKSLVGVTKQSCRVANTQSVGMAAIERWLLRTENNNDDVSMNNLDPPISRIREPSQLSNKQWTLILSKTLLLLLPAPLWEASTRGQFRKDDITLTVPKH